MKKIGFIGEGDCEVIFLKSDGFNELLNDLNFDNVGVFNAEGVGNLKIRNNKIDSFVRILLDRKAEYIIILADTDENECMKEYKESFHIYTDNQLLIFAVKSLESWFLADSETLSQLLRTKYFYEFPEKTPNPPYEVIRDDFKSHLDRGIEKKILSRKMIRAGFNLKNSASHPNSNSSKYFINKLKLLSR